MKQEQLCRELETAFTESSSSSSGAETAAEQLIDGQRGTSKGYTSCGSTPPAALVQSGMPADTQIPSSLQLSSASASSALVAALAALPVSSRSCSLGALQ